MNDNGDQGRRRRHGARPDGRPRARDAERLLDGRGTGSGDPATADLARLLSAAAGPLPGRPEDEAAALAAFRAAVADRSAPEGAAAGPAPVRPPAAAAARRRSLKVVIGGVVAAFALSGVALAAQTGALPHPFGHHPAPSTTRTGTGGSSTGASRPAPGTSGAPASPSASDTPSGASPGTSAPGPSASEKNHGSGTKGLCQAYENAAEMGKTLDSSAQERLARAAGGADQVASYCARLIGPTDSGEHTGGPTAPAESSGPTASAAPTTPASAVEATGPAAKPSPGHTTPSHSSGGGGPRR